MEPEANVDLLAAPAIDYSLAKVQHFDALFDAALKEGLGSLIQATTPYPTYEFLCYLVEYKQCLLHGSNPPTITTFEPRRQTDYEGRMVTAVFAAEDGIWPIFFAILDRANYKGSLRNECVRALDATGQWQTFYRFSINAELLPHAPWVNGTIYVFGRDSFAPVLDEAGQPRLEWASPVRVQPVARVPVTPADFPFLSAVKGHDDRLTLLAKKFFSAYNQLQELPDGYAFGYTWTTDWATELFTFIELLRIDEPTLVIELMCEPHQGPVWLHLHGSAAIKAQLQQAVEQARR